MTATIARPPLQILSMSSLQSGSRRHSARLQQKDDQPLGTNGTMNSGNAAAAKTTSTKAQTAATNSKKRKGAYEEEDDGFVFSRVKKKKARQSIDPQPNTSTALAPVPEVPIHSTALKKDGAHEAESVPTAQAKAEQPPPKKQRSRMSFSTPTSKAPQPVRRSKRLSTEAPVDRGSPASKEAQDLRPPKNRKEAAVQQRSAAHLRDEDSIPSTLPPVEVDVTSNTASQEEAHSSTKIALPFADTPVISRNKAMRQGKSGKSERRSSLGLRGRRASSLIDSGTSNALPHSEVEVVDFYKHIESELIEPRRMRQLLTWCATRAMHPKPQGTNFEDASVKRAAIVIEEELIKDLANKSELFDWFSREDVPVPTISLPERQHPKNIQNAEKIIELEEQIKRLRSEKDALESLLRPPSITPALNVPPRHLSTTTTEHLDENDVNIVHLLESNSELPSELSARVNKVISDVGPAVDVFADGVHKINQYRLGADSIASQVLSICAEKLTEREKAGRRKALGSEGDRSPRQELSGVLRGLSKSER